jgi:hypothetical protein
VALKALEDVGARAVNPAMTALRFVRNDLMNESCACQ